MRKPDFNQLIRVITIPPFMAFAALTALFWLHPETFQGMVNYLWAVFCLTLLPLLAYPLQPLIPGFKDKGREGQRQLAIIGAVAGYLLGVLWALLFAVPRQQLLIYLVYLISGGLILLFNQALRIRASGHACGVAGPLAFLCYLIGRESAFILLPVLALVYRVSLKLKRHTWPELLWGSLISPAALLLSLLVLPPA